MTRRALLVPLFAAAFVLVPAELSGRRAPASHPQETAARQTTDGQRTATRPATPPGGPGGMAG